MTKERLKHVIGNNIRIARTGRDMSIDELSELLELTSGFVGLIERGQRGATAHTLCKLADIFNAPVDDFFAENVKMAEGAELAVTAKRDKVVSLLYSLSEPELNFLVESIKNLRTLRNGLLGLPPVAEDQDDFEDE